MAIFLRWKMKIHSLVTVTVNQIVQWIFNHTARTSSKSPMKSMICRQWRLCLLSRTKTATEQTTTFSDRARHCSSSRHRHVQHRHHLIPWLIWVSVALFGQDLSVMRKRSRVSLFTIPRWSNIFSTIEGKKYYINSPAWLLRLDFSRISWRWFSQTGL